LKRQQEKEKELEFRKIYGETINEALLVLGYSISRIIALYVNEKYSMRLIDTYNSPNLLTEALKSTIDGGTRIIQRRILRILYEKIEIEPDFAILMNFEEKIVQAKKIFEENNTSPDHP
jgi:hypothetical protein